MKFKTRKRLALLVLIVGLPLYLVAAVVIVNSFDRPPILLELAVYIGLGVLWALPFKRLFLGIARPDPDLEGEATATEKEKAPH
jgi:hypothetical protein